MHTLLATTEIARMNDELDQLRLELNEELLLHNCRHFLDTEMPKFDVDVVCEFLGLFERCRYSYNAAVWHMTDEKTIVQAINADADCRGILATHESPMVVCVQLVNLIMELYVLDGESVNGRGLLWYAHVRSFAVHEARQRLPGGADSDEHCHASPRPYARHIAPPNELTGLPQ